MKPTYLILTTLFCSLIFCNDYTALADNSVSARDDQTGDWYDVEIVRTKINDKRKQRKDA